MIKPLVTNKTLEELLGAFHEKTVKRFEEKWDTQNVKIIHLQSKIAIQDNGLQKDINIINKVERCFDEICVKFDLNEIGRVPYIGKSIFHTGSIIVKFKSWELQTASYKGCPRNFMNGRNSFSVLLDLMKRCYSSLAKAKGVVKDNPSVAYALCDMNCSLAIKFNDSRYKYFNKKNELRKLLVL